MMSGLPSPSQSAMLTVGVWPVTSTAPSSSTFPALRRLMASAPPLAAAVWTLL